MGDKRAEIFKESIVGDVGAGIFPQMLNGVKIGAVGGDVHQGYVMNVFAPPIVYTLEMMVFGVIYRHNRCSMV